jgi:phenylacetate-CoA ligase
MTGEDELRKRHLAEALALAPLMLERQTWPLARLTGHRTVSLRKLLRTAVDRSPWHRKRLRGLDPDRFDPAQLHQLPVMTKDDLMDHFDEIVTDSRLSLERIEAHLEQGNGAHLLERYIAIASSGSSGRRGFFVYDWEAWTTVYLGCRRPVFRILATDPALAAGHVVFAGVSAGSRIHATGAMAYTFSGPQFQSVRLPVTLPLEEIVAGLNGAQPTFLHGYPSALYDLAREAEAGHLLIQPRGVICGGEPLLPEIRACLQSAWEAPVINVWGISEGGGAATSCQQGSLHLSEDMVVVEPVDQAGRAVEAGTRSASIYLTNLFNHTLPLIRYEITDEVTVRQQACPCGSAHCSIEDIQGRLDDTFAFGRLKVHPHVFRSALGCQSKVLEYQVRQTPRGAAISVRCCGPVDLRLLERQLADGLERLGLEAPEVTITAVDSLVHLASGKLKRFIRLNSA